MPDDAHLKDLEAAAVLRVSTNTLAAWRGVPGHPLKWTTIPGGFVRYEAGELKRFRASGGGRRKPSGRPKGSKDKSKSAPRRARRAKADDATQPEAP